MLGVRILFTYENLLPNDQADSEQFVNTAGALARAGHEVELLVPRKTGRTGQSAAEMLGYYQVEAPLTLTELPSFDRHLWIQHVVHAAQVSRHPKPKQFDLLYTRNLAMLTACVHPGIPSAYEHFRPWPAQFPPIQPCFPPLFAHRPARARRADHRRCRAEPPVPRPLSHPHVRRADLPRRADADIARPPVRRPVGAGRLGRRAPRGERLRRRLHDNR